MSFLDRILTPQVQRRVEELVIDRFEEAVENITDGITSNQEIGLANQSPQNRPTETDGNINATSQTEDTQEIEEDSASSDVTGRSNPSAGAYLVCKGATCKCQFGGSPFSPLLVQQKKYYANDKLIATEKDVNFQITPAPFITCTANPSLSKECVYAPPASWTWTSPVSSTHPEAGSGILVLTDDAELFCQKFMGKITIVTHGQQVSVSDTQTTQLAPALNCLVPIDEEIVDKNPENKEIKVSVNHISYGDTKSNESINIQERANKQLVFKAQGNNSEFTNWAVRKGNNGKWTIYSEFGEILPLMFPTEGKYTIAGYGRKNFVFSPKDAKADKGCYFNLEIVSKNTITHLQFNTGTVRESHTVVKGLPCVISPKTLLELDEEERQALKLEIKNGENDTLIHIQHGDAPYALATDQATMYSIYMYYEGEEKPNPIKITIEENSVIDISPSDIKVKHNDRITYIAKLKSNNNIDLDKIRWKVNGVEEGTGKELTYKFFRIVEHTIEACYDSNFLFDRSYKRKVTVERNTIKDLSVSGITSSEGGVIGRVYTVKAETVFPFEMTNDGKVDWSISFVPAKNSQVKGVIAEINTPENVDMKANLMNLSTKNSFQIVGKACGTYTVTAKLGSVTKAFKFELKESEVISWRLVGLNDWTLKDLGWQQKFTIDLNVKGWQNTSVHLSFFIKYTTYLGIKDNYKVYNLGSINIENGKATKEISADHELWSILSKVDGTLKNISLVIGNTPYPFATMHSVQDKLAYYLPNNSGELVCPQVRICQKVVYDGRFVDASGNKLMKIVKYGEPVKAQIRILEGKAESSKSKDYDFFFTFKENKGIDKTIDQYKQKEIVLDENGYMEMDIQTDVLGKDTHVTDKKSEFNPRLFYFILESDNKNRKFNYKTKKYVYPDSLDDFYNDETLIDLEVSSDTSEEKVKEVNKKNEEKLKGLAKKDKVDYFRQLKVAENTSLNASLASLSPVIIGEALSVEKNGHSSDGNCPRCKAAVRGIKADVKSEDEIALIDIFPDVADTILKDVADMYTKYMVQLDMATCWNKAHFFAQAAIETGYKLKIGDGEGFNYYWEALITTFGAFKSVEGKTKAEEWGRAIKDRNNPNCIDVPEETQIKIANYAYGPPSSKATELGNTEVNDGWSYRGQGLIQLTGKSAYIYANEYTKKELADIVLNPKLVSEKVEIGVLSAMAFWKWKSINSKANKTKDVKKDICPNVGKDVFKKGKNGENSSNYQEKQRAFNDETSTLFKIDDCLWGNEVPLDTTDIITYHVYANSLDDDKRIIKQIPKENKHPNSRKYIYYDKNKTPHIIGIFDMINVSHVTHVTPAANTAWTIISGYDTSKTWEHDSNPGVDAKTSYYYNNENGETDYILVKGKNGSIKKYSVNHTIKREMIKMEEINASESPVKFTFKNTDRIYCGSDSFAVFIGALGHTGESYNCTGNTHKDGTGFPSVSHVNGGGFDFEKGTTKNRKMLEAMALYGCLKFNVGDKSEFNALAVPLSEVTIKRDQFHNDHLHCGPFLDNISTIKTQKDK